MNDAVSDSVVRDSAMPTAAEGAMLLILLLLMTLVYGYALWIGASALWRWMRHRPRPQHKMPWRVLRVATLVLAAAGVACMLYAWRVEPYWPEVTTFGVNSGKIPKGTAVRIVHISDTHCEADLDRLENDLPSIIRDLKPDLIVWTGDAANGLGGVNRFRRLMAELAQIAPTYGVRGNWDYAMAGLLQGTGATEIDGKPVNLDVRGARLCLVGGPAGPWAPTLQSLEQAQSDRYIILLHHLPDMVLHLKGRKPDIMLSGHTHGGQIRLPLYGAVVTLQKTGQLFEDGLVEYGGTRVHVSRGIGMEGAGFAPRMRFLCRPEIAVIDLAGE